MKGYCPTCKEEFEVDWVSPPYSIAHDKEGHYNHEERVKNGLLQQPTEGETRA